MIKVANASRWAPTEVAVTHAIRSGRARREARRTAVTALEERR